MVYGAQAPFAIGGRGSTAGATLTSEVQLRSAEVASGASTGVKSGCREQIGATGVALGATSASVEQSLLAVGTLGATDRAISASGVQEPRAFGASSDTAGSALDNGTLRPLSAEPHTTPLAPTPACRAQPPAGENITGGSPAEGSMKASCRAIAAPCFSCFPAGDLFVALLKTYVSSLPLWRPTLVMCKRRRRLCNHPRCLCRQPLPVLEDGGVSRNLRDPGCG